MRVLLDFFGMPALYNNHCFTFSTATLAELRREDVPGYFLAIQSVSIENADTQFCLSVV